MEEHAKRVDSLFTLDNIKDLLTNNNEVFISLLKQYVMTKVSGGLSRKSALAIIIRVLFENGHHLLMQLPGAKETNAKYKNNQDEMVKELEKRLQDVTLMNAYASANFRDFSNMLHEKEKTVKIPQWLKPEDITSIKELNDSYPAFAAKIAAIMGVSLGTVYLNIEAVTSTITFVINRVFALFRETRIPDKYKNPLMRFVSSIFLKKKPEASTNEIEDIPEPNEKSSEVRSSGQISSRKFVQFIEEEEIANTSGRNQDVVVRRPNHSSFRHYNSTRGKNEEASPFERHNDILGSKPLKW